MKPPTGLRARRSGQAIVFLLLVFTVLAFLVLFNIDLHRIIRGKNQAQNAGDSAALATARWQGASLNLIGELNLMHVLALASDDANAVDAVTNMQARLSVTGPLAALYAAQVAAKNNHIYVDPVITSFYKSHAGTVRSYGSQVNASGALYYPEPWPGAWAEYADILDAICDDGLAAGPDNARFFSDPQGGHVLFLKEFYEAVAGASWCWFHLFQPGLLETYHSHNDWPPIPDVDTRGYSNSEIFGLGLHPLLIPTVTYARPPLPASELEEYVDPRWQARDLSSPPMYSATNSVEIWYMYNSEDWRAWDEIKEEAGFEFPAAGRIFPEYDYVGADAVLRVSATIDRIMPEGGGNPRGATGTATVNWTAAAKPFGYLDYNGDRTRPNDAARLVLPAFRNVRLIPADTASNSDASSSDIEWIYHIRQHLPVYMDCGRTSPNCPYCDALNRWEIQPFRQSGIDWLKENSTKCRLPSGGGSRHGGGSRRGH